jgi:solute carrier family 25 carnitine/acylcarnitine transporter 20/29
VACSMVACPTELVKCRLQAQSALATTVEAPILAGVGAAGGTSAVKAAVQYSGPFDVARHVLKSEGGVVGLYKGLTPTLMREVPGNAAMFGAYEATKQYLAGGKIPSSFLT